MIVTIIAASSSVAPLPARSDALDTARFLACIAACEHPPIRHAVGVVCIALVRHFFHSSLDVLARRTKLTA